MQEDGGNVMFSAVFYKKMQFGVYKTYLICYI